MTINMLVINILMYVWLNKSFKFNMAIRSCPASVKTIQLWWDSTVSLQTKTLNGTFHISLVIKAIRLFLIIINFKSMCLFNQSSITPVVSLVPLNRPNHRISHIILIKSLEWLPRLNHYVLLQVSEWVKITFCHTAVLEFHIHGRECQTQLIFTNSLITVFYSSENSPLKFDVGLSLPM